jgi:hypothetical protein
MGVSARGERNLEVRQHFIGVRESNVVGQIADLPGQVNKLPHGSGIRRPLLRPLPALDCSGCATQSVLLKLLVQS